MIEASKNNMLGIICNSHMAFADKSLLKAKDPKCIKLCKYFNQEVDASKTGDFIDISTLEKEKLLEYNRPDFLNDGNCNIGNVYESPGILGKLFRNINHKKLYSKFKMNFFNKAIRRKYEININFITKNCFSYLIDAYKIYNQYKIRLCNLMKKYNFCTEGELFLNFRIFKKNRGTRGKNDSYNIEIKKLIEETHKEIIEKFGPINLDVASAIYIVSYINVRSISEKINTDYKINLEKLKILFEKEKNDFKELFKKYDDYSNLKRNNKEDNKNRYKRIFSLPWVIKDIRELLISII